MISHRVADKLYCKCLELMTIPDKIKLNSLNISYSRNWFAEEESKIQTGYSIAFVNLSLLKIGTCVVSGHQNEVRATWNFV